MQPIHDACSCRYAIVYLRCRCLAAPAALSNYVLYGTFRGFRDTTCVPRLCHYYLRPCQNLRHAATLEMKLGNLDVTTYTMVTLTCASSLALAVAGLFCQPLSLVMKACAAGPR